MNCMILGIMLGYFFSLQGCMDYLRLENAPLPSSAEISPPIIDMSHISPHPSRLVDAISVGKNCKGQTFKVPPIDDQNSKDRLHYIWFLDNQLVLPQSVIEPENRATAIITLNIDEHFLLAHFENKVPKDFFNRSHVIEFFVSDLAYTIPESRFIDYNKGNEKKHGDYAYWIIMFINDPC